MVGTAPPLAESGGQGPASDTAPWLNPEWIRTDSLAFLRFTAVGTPKPKARPRTVRNKQTGFSQTYTPDDTVTWEGAIGWQTKQALAAMTVAHPGEFDVLPLVGRLMFDLRFNVKRPASLPKKVQFPLKTRPGDIDNLAKSVLDALQNVGVIRDDCQVTDMNAIKRFAEPGHPEGVEIELTGWL